MILERAVNSMDDLAREMNVLPNHFAFRGQANADWGLTSTLERVIGRTWSAENARRFESYSLQLFQSKYHIYSGSEHIPTSKLSWLSVMQHYGVPTRLIDFTTSPYIALYFALENYDPLSKHDFAVYAIDYTAVMEASIQHIKKVDTKFVENRSSLNGKQDAIFADVVDRYAYDIAWVTEPKELNARIDRQSGTFLVSGNLEKTIESVVNLPLYESATILKIRVPAHLYEGVYVALRKMSINSKSIYGDLGGLAKSIRMELQSYNQER